MLIAQRRHHTSTFIEKKRFLSEFDVPQCNRGKNTCVTTFRENQFSLCWDTLVFWRKKEDFLYIFSLTVTDISKWGKNLKKTNKKLTMSMREDSMWRLERCGFWCLQEEEQSVTGLTKVFDFRRGKNEKCLRLKVKYFVVHGEELFPDSSSKVISKFKRIFLSLQFHILIIHIANSKFQIWKNQKSSTSWRCASILPPPTHPGKSRFSKLEDLSPQGLRSSNISSSFWRLHQPTKTWGKFSTWSWH